MRKIDLEKYISDVKNAEKIEEVGKKSIIIGITSLVKTLPVVGSIIDGIEEDAKNIISAFVEDKRDCLISYINSGEENITTERLKDVSFIMNLCKTVEAVDRLSTYDKIQYFANLFKNSYLKPEKTEASLYDEYFELLRELSYREITILYQIYEYEISLPSHEPFNWNGLYGQIASSEEEIESLKATLMKLNGRGLLYFNTDASVHIIAENSPPPKRGTTKYLKNFIQKIIDIKN